LRSVVQAGALYIETPGIRLHEFHNWHSSHSLTGLREHPEPPGLSPAFILKRRFLPAPFIIRRQSPDLYLTLPTICARRAAGRQLSVSIASLNRTILSSIQLRRSPEISSGDRNPKRQRRICREAGRTRNRNPSLTFRVGIRRHECSPKVVRDCSYVTRVPLAIV
jgi:hypothetical protein